jgi:hypothetical protein
MIQGEDTEGAANLRIAESGGLGFPEGAKSAGAAVDHTGREMPGERSSACAGTRGVGKNVEVGERKRLDEMERGVMLSFGFTGKARDDVGANGGVSERFADELDASLVVAGAVPAVHGGEDAVRPGLERHVKVFGNAICGGGEQRDEILSDVERLNGADAEAGERGFVENAAQEIEKIHTGRQIPAPSAEIDSTEHDFLVTGIRKTPNF